MPFSALKNPAAPRELPVLAHAALVAMASAWLFGGLGPNGEWIVAALASPALWFLFAEARTRVRAGDRTGVYRLLRWSAPLAVLALLIVVSALNPSHRAAFIYDDLVLRPVPHIAWLPSSANPLGSLRVLACLGGLAATGLAIAFCVHSRNALRTLVLVLALNAVALSILGTLQRQTGATGPFFGAVPAANEAWFATFHYYNHWGAFAVLHAAAALGLVFRSLRHPPARGWVFGPGPLLIIAALLIAATAPLSGSRSATALMAALSACAATLAIWRVARTSRHAGSARRRLPAALTLAAVLLLGGGLVAFQSRDILAHRAAQTRTQLSSLANSQDTYGRPALYADTWRMAADAPVFGWGLESYGRVFLRYSTFTPGVDGLMNTYEDAHSDWLQALAELGFVGTLLLMLSAALPLAESWRASLRDLPSPAGWLLAGCALLAAYAWLEFPFACPAVVATWWIHFFSALRLSQLTPSAPSGSSPQAPRS